MRERELLQALEEQIARTMASGVVTQQKVDTLILLRAMVGERYDAVNGVWRPLEETKGASHVSA